MSNPIERWNLRHKERRESPIVTPGFEALVTQVQELSERHTDFYISSYLREHITFPTYNNSFTPRLTRTKDKSPMVQIAYAQHMGHLDQGRPLIAGIDDTLQNTSINIDGYKVVTGVRWSSLEDFVASERVPQKLETVALGLSTENGWLQAKTTSEYDNSGRFATFRPCVAVLAGGESKSQLLPISEAIHAQRAMVQLTYEANNVLTASVKKHLGIQTRFDLYREDGFIPQYVKYVLPMESLSALEAMIGTNSMFTDADNCVIGLEKLYHHMPGMNRERFRDMQKIAGSATKDCEPDTSAVHAKVGFIPAARYRENLPSNTDLTRIGVTPGWRSRSNGWLYVGPSPEFTHDTLASMGIDLSDSSLYPLQSQLCQQAGIEFDIQK
jgi:hypothetical protein